jgi:hypothetical protein
MAADVTYQMILHDVALRMSALVGLNANILATTYDKNVLAPVDFKSADWPFNAFRDAILMAVADYSRAIADTRPHTWRADLAGVTADLANAAQLPSFSTAAKEIIGVWGDVVDSGDLTPLEERPLEEVRRVNLEDWRTLPVYIYHMADQQINHTRAVVKIRCCTYSQSDQMAAWITNGFIPLPGVLRPAIMARAISIMVRDSSLIDQAQVYRAYSDQAEMAIRAGSTKLPEGRLP